MADLALRDVGRTFGGLWVVRALSLNVHDGEFVTLLGPSGCGKTTTLRMIAGFIPPTTGEIALGGRVLSSAATGAVIPPEHRGMGMVFQNYAVWPHMTAAGNVAYPLRRARLSRAEVQAQTRRALSLVHLEAFADRHPQELSGGSSSAWRWRAPSSWSRPSSSSMNRSATSMRSCAKRCGANSETFRSGSASPLSM